VGQEKTKVRDDSEDTPIPTVTPESAIHDMIFDLLWRKGQWGDRPDPNGVVPHLEKKIEALHLALKRLERERKMSEALVLFVVA
jgi:hypothetical protein